MTPSLTRLGREADFAHHHFLALVALAYVSAAACPGPGLALARSDAGALLSGRPGLPLPHLLLAGLLFNAGLGVNPRAVLDTLRRPRVLLARLLADLLEVPPGGTVMNNHCPREAPT